MSDRQGKLRLDKMPFFFQDQNQGKGPRGRVVLQRRAAIFFLYKALTSN